MRGGWTTEEDIKLTGLITSATPPSWQDISEIHFASSRTPSQCRHRWHDTLKVEIAKKTKKSGSTSTSAKRATERSAIEVKASSSDRAPTTRTRANAIQQHPSTALFTLTEDALLLQLLKEGHSPIEIERRWSEFSRRISGSSGGGGSAGRMTRGRKEKGAVEERARSVEQDNRSTLHRHPRTFFPPPIVEHDLFHAAISPPKTLEDAPHPSSSSSLSSFSLSPPRPRPRPPTTALPAEPRTPPRSQRTPFSLTRRFSSSPPRSQPESVPRQKEFTALELLAQVAESPKKGRAVKCLLSGEEDEEGAGEGKENGEVRRGLLFVSPKKRKGGGEVELAPKEGGKRLKM